MTENNNDTPPVMEREDANTTLPDNVALTVLLNVGYSATEAGTVMHVSKLMTEVNQSIEGPHPLKTKIGDGIQELLQGLQQLVTTRNLTTEINKAREEMETPKEDCCNTEDKENCDKGDQCCQVA